MIEIRLKIFLGGVYFIPIHLEETFNRLEILIMDYDSSCGFDYEPLINEFNNRFSKYNFIEVYSYIPIFINENNLN